jgi:hypothetical protein
MSYQTLAVGLGITILLGGWSAQARVFNVNSESLAAYVSGTWSPTFDNTLTSESNTNSSTSVSINARHPYNLSGEFGFIYAQPRVNLRFGLEVIHPFDIKDEIGKDSNGGELYSLTSETSVLIPKVAIEVTAKRFSTTRLLVTGGVGYGYLIARNSYTFTPTGTAKYGGIPDFYEDLRGYAMMYEGSVGLEGLLSDMTTYVLQAGYRSLNFTEVKHNREVVTFQGPVNPGDVAQNKNGQNRTLDLSNFYLGIQLRFWIH